MMFSSGPPCMPGKTAESSAFAHFSLQSTMPPRGPPSVLCVVVVTKSAYGTGDSCAPPATRPAMWAMSTIMMHPTLSQISRMRLKSIARGYADAPVRRIFGFTSRAWRSSAS